MKKGLAVMVASCWRLWGLDEKVTFCSRDGKKYRLFCKLGMVMVRKYNFLKNS